MGRFRESVETAAIPRRELLRVGGLSLLGLSAGELRRLRALASGDETNPRRRNSCVFLFLFGGPSHIDLWDMKPQAPAEIRGDFKPIDTAAPGVQICEHLPLLARQADKLCLLRSMEHRMPVHGPACSEMYSGRPYFGPPTTDQALPEDWPSLAALAMRFGQRSSGLPPSVVLPWYTQFVGQDKRIAGQTGGRMGERFNPYLVPGDPSDPAFEAPGIKLPQDLSTERLKLRRELLRGMADGQTLDDRDVELFQFHSENAFSLVGDGKTLEAFSLAREPAAVRTRYGPARFAQSLLLARRLVEAGASLITVNWDDDSKFDKVSPHWDTHHDNFATLKNRLTPMFDQCLSAFLADLHDRGLLETTLVVATGEFGRTPKIGQFTQNGMTQKTGRDHWPYAFTVLLAGGGVRGGQAYGATDKNGAFVKESPVSPADLAATIFHHLGIDHRQEYWDEFQQTPRRLATGEPIRDLG